MEAAQQMIRDRGAPEWAAEHVGNIVKDIDAGTFSRDTGQVVELLGRDPRNVTDLLRENVAFFRA